MICSINQLFDLTAMNEIQEKNMSGLRVAAPSPASTTSLEPLALANNTSCAVVGKQYSIVSEPRKHEWIGATQTNTGKNLQGLLMSAERPRSEGGALVVAAGQRWTSICLEKPDEW